MDALQQRITQAVEGKIDFEGQKRVDQIARISLIALTAISFLVGFVLQSLKATFVLFGIGTTVVLLITVPPWPLFNQHPIKWLSVREKGAK
ncbi:microsomal signal peptidase [Irpex rosettiformis]|uniref:Microsomal signal peptidase n=1 Tax=Irpex rosettiformis TaxID=378272 RepID=A0ACB8TR47_9APHY|nr:microsomal signal peptidase [Irpex rosettiformis]